MKQWFILQLSELIKKSDKLKALNPYDASAIVLDVSEGDDEVKLTIKSDNLKFAQKLDIEKNLKAQFSEKYPDSSLLVSFKKTVVKEKSANPKAVEADGENSRLGVKKQTKAIPGVSKVIAVASGKGGVGKSTVSSNLAVSLSKKGYKVGLLDADIYGPSAPLMFNLKGPMAVASGNRIIPLENYGVKVASMGFLADDTTPVIWRGPVVSGVVNQLIYETVWGELDYLVVDLPPGTGDVQMTLMENLPIYTGIVVSTPQMVALLDAHKGLSMFEKLEVPVLGVVENMAFFSCPSCGHNEEIFGHEAMEEFKKSRRLELLSRIPLQSAIRKAADAGAPVALEDSKLAEPYHKLADAVIAYSPKY